MERIRRIEKPVQITPKLFIVAAEFPHQWNSNSYLILGNEPTIIDCGSSEGTANLRSNLNHLGLDFPDITNVIATHEHRDHIHGIHEIRKHNPHVNFYVHEEARDAIETGDYHYTAGSIYERPFEPAEIKDEHVVKDGDVIEIDKHPLYIHHTPGHTRGSITPRMKVGTQTFLFGGDTIFGQASETTDSDIYVWKKSLYKIEALDYDVILNGHNPVQDLPLSREALTRYLPHFGKMLNPWFLLPQAE